MTASFTNKTKNIASPYNGRKAAIYYWGDAVATWGDSVATWGNGLLSVTNQTKSTVPSTTIPVGSAMGLLLTLTYANAVTVGSGVTNQSKS